MLPVARTSKARKGIRRSHHAVVGKQVVRCPKCNQSKLPHRLCANCGYLNKSLTVDLGNDE
jgi:large subunit ribosomal protein L32